MSELRKDIISGRWTIIASERSKRPDDFRSTRTESQSEGRGFCPFCEGNESKTPPEVFSLRKSGTESDGPGWRVRVVPNKFPALNRGPVPSGIEAKGLFPKLEGVGVHEVVIETPDHNRELSDLPLDHIREVLWTYQERIRAIEREVQYQYIQVFKNKGKEAGASLSHPHTQIVATPIIPKRIMEEIYGAGRAYHHAAKCIFCRILEEEMKTGERLVARNGHFCATTPFAARFPFELRLLPLRHSPSYSSLSGQELQSLAGILKFVLSRIKSVLSDPPFNFIIHQGPSPHIRVEGWPDIEKTYHWHLEIMPILTKVAGFELGTGFYINPVPPETAASYLRGQGPRQE